MKLVLVHWNAEEAKARARPLKQSGHSVRLLCDAEKPRLQTIRESPPQLFIIDLTRLPSHGREIAGHFRRMKATRQVPILFVGGDDDRVSRARDLFPDAEFAAWEAIDRAIPKSIRKAPANPVVPGTMASYSGTPLPKKLCIKPGTTFILANAPARFERKLEPLPDGAALVENAASAQLAVLFAASQAELLRDFRELAKALPEKSALWIAWPKKASGVRTDLTDDTVREFGLGQGWVDYKVCAIDETWSGLCFARKK